MNRLVVAMIFTVSMLTSVGALANQTQIQLGVDGLACPFCAYGIEKKIIHTAGVESLDIDIDAGTVMVTMAGDATMTEEQARQIVSDAGFTLSSFEIVQTTDPAERE